MRYSLATLVFAFLAAPTAANADDIPLVAIGLPFKPAAPRPVAHDHPLFELIDVPEIAELPATVGGSALSFIKAA